MPSATLPASITGLARLRPMLPANGIWVLKAAIRSLQKIPSRDPVTPEDKRLRHLLYGRKPHVYRVIYRILEQEKQVEVLHIRHGARDAFRIEEIADE